ncbi:hypothetical protein ACM46_10005 [Chryseobacterium angstadtii]|uniref:Uncharacterized protein n=1 Tax=Chryseobacterium angstadtii TaxID=558151 RepID=A0A0J7IF93_9FLAO|nr:hypothetical protein [Chryseobacterium angstadtii]KMQ64581.1 hypothetical protein ACM46_10005 [Chryseobacterium angstadtii]
MKLTDLIEKIQQGKTEQFLITNSIDIEYDLIDIYAKEKLGIDSEIKFFNAEEIPNEGVINVDGIEYENVCPLNMLEDLVNDFIIQDSQIDTFELTNQVLSYLEKDA